MWASRSDWHLKSRSATSAASRGLPIRWYPWTNAPPSSRWISAADLFDCGGELSRGKIGDFDAELVEEFLRAFSNNAGLNIYVKLLATGNKHHEAEAVFKALAQCLRTAIAVVSDKIPSSKGVL